MAKKRSKAFPNEVRILAYNLHRKGLNDAAILSELDKYCREKYTRKGPSQRALSNWKIQDDWNTQEELDKAALIEKMRPQLIEEQAKALERLSDMAQRTYKHYLDQVEKEDVRITPGQAIYALIELERTRLRMLDKGSKGPDIRKILESALEPFIRILKQELGQQFTEKQDVILTRLEQEVSQMK